MKIPPLVIAIDGPAASGKGALGRRVAEKLGFLYLDTGKLYRAVGLDVLDSGAEESKIKPAAIKAAQMLSPAKMEKMITRLNDEKVGEMASIISAIPEVRDALLDFQRLIADNPRGAVLDGRDIGTVICPNADFKFYITATIEARADRRFKELQKQRPDIIYTTVLNDLKARDARDSARRIAPLKPAGDAIQIDTTSLGMDEVFEKVLLIILSSAS